MSPLHLSETPYLLNFDCATALVHSTFKRHLIKDICLPSTNHPSPPPAPLHLRTPRHYTNAVIYIKIGLSRCVSTGVRGLDGRTVARGRHRRQAVQARLANGRADGQTDGPNRAKIARSGSLLLLYRLITKHNNLVRPMGAVTLFGWEGSRRPGGK